MEFLSNRDVLAAFEAIINEGQEIENNAANSEPAEEPRPADSDESGEKEDTENGSVS